MPNPNNTQQLVIDATSGTFSLTYFFPVTPTSLRASMRPLLTSPGLLTAGTHFYVVTGVDALGHESFVSNEVSVVTPDGASVELKWLPMPGAVSYRVYSRSGPASGNARPDDEQPDARRRRLRDLRRHGPRHAGLDRSVRHRRRLLERHHARACSGTRRQLTSSPRSST